MGTNAVVIFWLCVFFVLGKAIDCRTNAQEKKKKKKHHFNQKLYLKLDEMAKLLSSRKKKLRLTENLVCVCFISFWVVFALPDDSVIDMENKNTLFCAMTVDGV